MELPGRFLSHLRRSRLLGAGDRVVAAVSGGSDSTALAELLALAAERIGFELVAIAHLHHGLRGAEADGDEEACRAIAGRLAVPFRRSRVDVAAEARRSGESLEAEGRRCRYRFLASVASELGALVATGHTADDRLETLLLKLARGEGTGGVAGIRARRGDGVVRPLLPFRREELRAWLAARGVEWRDDASNESVDGPLRSRVRGIAIPALVAALGEELPQRAAASLDRLLEDDDFLEAEAARRLAALLRPEGSLDAAGLAAEPAAMARRILRRFLDGGGPRHVPDSSLPAILRAVAGAGRRRRYALAGGRQLLLQGGRLTVGPGAAIVPAVVPFDCELSTDGETVVPGAGGRFLARRICLQPGERPAAGAGVRWIAWLPLRGDAAGVPRLRVRNRRPGDRIHPLGAAGTRKLKEVLIDRRIPQDCRDRLPVVVVDDRPVWIPGVVMDECLRLSGSERDAVELVWEAER